MIYCETVKERISGPKGWTTSINRLLKKFRNMGTVDRRQGSDRPRSARTDENINQVNDMVLSQEDQPELTAQSVKYHGRQAFLYERIIRKDLQLKCFTSDVGKS